LTEVSPQLGGILFRTIFLCIVFFVLGAASGSFYCIGYLSKNPEIEKVGIGFSVAMIILAILILGIIKGFEDRVKEHKEGDKRQNLH
jgi:hypothetical protein